MKIEKPQKYKYKMQVWVQWGRDDSPLRGPQQVVHGDSRQVGVEVALVVSASKHQQTPADRVHIHRIFPLREMVAADCCHGDDGVPRPGDRELGQRHLCPAVGVWIHEGKAERQRVDLTRRRNLSQRALSPVSKTKVSLRALLPL